MKNNIVVFVQARMGSSRLRGKVLKNILEKPILLHMVSRVRLAKTVDKVVVITSNNKIDELIISSTLLSYFFSL